MTTILPQFLSVFFILLMAGNALAGTIVYSPEVLAASRAGVKQKDPALMPAYKKLIKDATKALDANPESVTFKPSAPLGGNEYDYWSLSPYWWPDADKPGGVPYVKRDGERNPEAATEKYDRQRLNRMSAACLTLAQAYSLTGNERYAKKAAKFIRVWFLDKATRMNPNMRFAQSRPGINFGHHTGIVESRSMLKVVEAASLLEGSKSWKTGDEKKLKRWFAKYVHWLQTSAMGKRDAAMPNNHAVWYDALVAAFALYAGEMDTARAMVENAVLRMDAQIQPDGSMPEELKRTRSRHYSFLTVEAYFVLAAVAERLGQDLWNKQPKSGGSMKQALDFAAPSLAKTAPWPHGKTGAYDPFAFTPLIHRAGKAYGDPGYLKYLDGLPDKRKRDRALLFH